MENELVQVERPLRQVVRLSPLGDAHDISLIPAILAAFEAEYEKGVRYYLLDLGNLSELLPSTVALIFELTGRARRHGGDVCVVGLAETTRQNLLQFHPETYLLLAESDPDALILLKQQPAAPPVLPASEEIRDSRMLEIEIPSRVESLYRACDFVTRIARRAGYPESELSKIKISVYEACLNAIEHAYHSDPNRRVRIQVMKEGDYLRIGVTDQGDGFHISGDEFDIVAAAAARQTGGMGLHIIQRSMDEVRYIQDPEKGNQLIMIKRLPPLDGLMRMAPGGPTERWPG